MLYFDYSATTPVNPQVLETFNKVSIDYPGNSNSLHKLGISINDLVNSATKQIADILNISEKEIIYTSGASESNNTAIKGIALRYKNRGKHIITTKYEHSSIVETVNYLESLGYEISYVKENENGIVNLEELKKLIRDDTILVSVTAVNSEIGLRNPIEEIGAYLKNNTKCFFHVDLTQSIGKIKIDLTNVDLASVSAHKFYGLKGVGILIKKENVDIVPLIHGGKSTTNYRSGTPAHTLIVSTSKALRLACENIDEKYEYVKKLNSKLKEELLKIDNVVINSNDYCIPHILNISVIGIKSETLMHALSEHEVYVSTKTACAYDNSMSQNVLDLTKDETRAKTSIRISLSYLTKEEEIEGFINIFKKVNESLLLK